MIRIVVPLGGEAKSFTERGYAFPKPLIEIGGKPMIELVVDNLKPKEPHQFVFICRRDHIQRFALADVLRLVSPGSIVMEMEGSTAGALCSVLLAIEHINRDQELLVVNGDQVVDVAMADFLKRARKSGTDGCLMTFPSTHPKWSYARVDNNGEVQGVAEKRPISHHATVGLYYFKRGGDFIDGAEQMILKNATVAGEFYVCPVYNELILSGKRVMTYPIKKEQMHSLGTPDDVEHFIVEKINIPKSKKNK